MSIAASIAGIGGRMGRALLRAAMTDPRIAIIGGTEQAESALIGVDISRLAEGCVAEGTVSRSVTEAASKAAVWIDFTQPAATIASLEALAATDVRGLIIGTTGFTTDQLSALHNAASRFSIVLSGNFSLGVNVLAALVRQVAERLGPDWDIEITEAHHRHKVDAPSGTAMLLAEAAAAGRRIKLDDAIIPPRWGQTGARPDGGIGMSVVRAGGIVGEHAVMFGSESEIIRFTHSALDRAIFAKGALAAALWAADQPPGFYGMGDVLGL